MSSTEILSLVEQYKEAQQLIEAAQAEMDDLKRQITEEMTRRDVDTMDAGTHKVRYQTADELEKVLQYIQTVKHRRTAE